MALFHVKAYLGNLCLPGCQLWWAAKINWRLLSTLISTGCYNHRLGGFNQRCIGILRSWETQDEDLNRFGSY